MLKNKNDREWGKVLQRSRCMNYGFKTTDLVRIDRSKTVYFDVLNYTLPALQKVDSLAKSFISTIEIFIKTTN